MEVGQPMTQDTDVNDSGIIGWSKNLDDEQKQAHIEQIRNKLGSVTDGYDESIIERLKRFLFGCGHEYKYTGHECFRCRPAEMSLDESCLVVKKEFYKPERCIICGDYRKGVPTEVEEREFCRKE